MSAEVPPHLSLEQTIYRHPGFLVRRMQQIAVAIFLEEAAGSALTPLQYGVLAAVRAHPGSDQIGVAERIGLDRTTVLGIVNRLERKRLLRRRVDARDRRARRLVLTAAGRRLLANIQPAVDRAQRRMLEPLSDAERALLVQMLGRVVGHHNESSRVPVTAADDP